jgi:NhaP-type Na+/H+ or K+/H+ antiporter
MLCVVTSETVGASMFIAAFIAGLVVQIGFKDGSQHSIEFAEEWGEVLNLSVFFLFGLLVTQYWHQFDLASVLYALLSLRRMLPVAIALVVIFLGWFGARGLASIVLGLVYLEHEIHLPGETTIRLAVMMTVLISIFAHGLTAMPGIGLYARKIKSVDRRASK